MKSPEKPKRNILARILIRAAKIPSLYLILGGILVAISYVDDVFSLSAWQKFFTISDEVGNILIALALITFVYNFFVMVCWRAEKHLHEKHKVAAMLLSNLRKGMRIIFILIAINLIVTILAPTRYYLALANDIINVIIIISIGWIAVQILYTAEAVIYQYMITVTRDEHIRIKALYTKMHIIRNIATVVIAILTIAAVLMSFNSFRNIGISLLASAGFITAVVGLAAQKSLYSIFSGLQIALSQPIKIGDVVVVGKEAGIVEEINFTYVTLKLGDSRRFMVPITYFIENPFENWSHEGHSLRSSLHFYIDYMMPIQPLREQLDEILKESPYWDGVAKKLQVSNLNEHSVEIRIQISSANADSLSDLRAEVKEKILCFIRDNYPQHFPKMREIAHTT